MGVTKEELCCSGDVEYMLNDLCSVVLLCFRLQSSILCLMCELHLDVSMDKTLSQRAGSRVN